MNVLIVDDSKPIRLLINEYVTTSGHSATMVEDGQQAIEATHKDKYDLILMDVEMPGLNGFETTRRIREFFPDDWFPIVFLSSNSEDSHIEKGIQSGADAYLTKPISGVALMAQINAMARISEMRHSLHNASIKIQNILDNAVDGIITINQSGVIESFNVAAQKLFGYSQEEVIGQNVKLLMDEYHRSRHDDYLQHYVNTGVKKIIGIGREVEGLRKDGSSFPLELSISEVVLDEEHLFVGLARDISERKMYEENLQQAHEELKKSNVELEKLSLVDALTQLANRRHFDQRLDQELRRAHRERSECSLILCDIDYFKRFNDSCGHQAGDSCLKRVAAVIARSLHRSTELAARYGGEEFAIILPSTDQKGAVVVAERIREALWQENIPHSASEIADRVTLSLGVASSGPGNEVDTEALIESADRALYRAKEEGRNQSST